VEFSRSGQELTIRPGCPLLYAGEPCYGRGNVPRRTEQIISAARTSRRLGDFRTRGSFVAERAGRGGQLLSVNDHPLDKALYTFA